MIKRSSATFGTDNPRSVLYCLISHCKIRLHHDCPPFLAFVDQFPQAQNACGSSINAGFQSVNRNNPSVFLIKFYTTPTFFSIKKWSGHPTPFLSSLTANRCPPRCDPADGRYFIFSLPPRSFPQGNHT